MQYYSFCELPQELSECFLFWNPTTFLSFLSSSIAPFAPKFHFDREQTYLTDRKQLSV